MKWFLPVLFFVSLNAFAEFRLVVPKESYLTDFNLRDGELFTSEDSKVLFIHVDGEATQVLNPSGVILAFGGTVAPTGYLLCDGTAISRTTYANLFAAIGTAFGSGDGSTTFNLPDLRGRFLRGVDGTAGRDPDKATRTAMNTGGNIGNNVGSAQTDELKSHTHTLNMNEAYTHQVGVNAPAGQGNAGQRAYTYPSSSTGGNETRPENANVNFIIKI